ncbi:hypothetical protein [Gelidibacter maritimus]|uniref:Uncharacterized protein n=1 Tax=Gelidibacter maritimus TaxID=2761487 RepID=A0A7W2M958_9FLAO|nr:hypothetical protein [Gelidibacter maritimus]MBA6154892.1 hypothetical protein [Gelidibacter maritimus]
MNKIPIKIKYMICGISAMIFLLFLFGIINPFGLNDSLQKITGYFFGFSFNNLDYLAISSIPIFGMLLNSKRKEFKTADLIKDILIIVLFVIITISIGLYILTFIGKPTNPLIPQYLITEPFFLYSTLTVGIGIGLPFLLINRTEKLDEINEIGIEK